MLPCQARIQDFLKGGDGQGGPLRGGDRPCRRKITIWTHKIFSYKGGGDHPYHPPGSATACITFSTDEKIGVFLKIGVVYIGRAQVYISKSVAHWNKVYHPSFKVYLHRSVTCSLLTSRDSARGSRSLVRRLRQDGVDSLASPVGL